MVLLFYSGRGFNKIDKVIRIPVIEYLSVGLLALIFRGGIRLYHWVSQRQGTRMAEG